MLLCELIRQLKRNAQIAHHLFDSLHTDADGGVLLPGLQSQIPLDDRNILSVYLNIAKFFYPVRDKQPKD